ncbi:hypothetical protein ABD87_14935 [Lysinibacillus sphaericus]|uniref:hypothetical protein n=1 Tax=Lysinibacillus sphaericus TaxID=1421 RepID=UPI0018CC8243|nr:hypothetical protein [Lysinibacillus sphaericus]MBG9730789.1 hypothetical protein [Lysinibacillus sphaericus]
MKLYTDEHLFAEDNYFITVCTDYQYKARTLEDAFKRSIANEIYQCIKVYFNLETNDIEIEIKRNSLFTTCTITSFNFYDETKAKYRVNTEDGLPYPIDNEECYVSMSKKMFVSSLSEYFKKNEDVSKKNRMDGVGYIPIECHRGA